MTTSILSSRDDGLLADTSRAERLDIDLSRVRRVLVVRLDRIGDVVLTTPFLRELRRNLPSAWISLVVNSKVRELMALCPYVNEVLSFQVPRPRWRRPWRWGWAGICYVRAAALARRRLQPRRFDLAILPRWGVDGYGGTFLLHCSGARIRVGYSETVDLIKRRFNRGYDRLLTHAVKGPSLPKHEVERTIDVLRVLGCQVHSDQLELWIGKDDEAFAEAFLDRHRVSRGELLIGFGIGADEEKRRWPLASFKTLGAWLHRDWQARFLLIGGPGEEGLGEQMLEALGSAALNMIGKTTLRQAAALMRHCQVYVTNDTGPMHLAAAVGVPVIELSCHPMSGSPYSSHAPERIGPWGSGHTVLQPDTPLRPCREACGADHAHCILQITVEVVQQAVGRQLGQDGRRS